MKDSKTTSQFTTVSVDGSVRDRINKEAVRLGLSQRQMISRMVEAYELKVIADNFSGDSPPAELQDVYSLLEKVLKRDDRVIAFIRTQEQQFLKPILTKENLNSIKISDIATKLTELISKI